VNEEIYLLSPQAPPWRVTGLLYFTFFITIFEELYSYICDSRKQGPQWTDTNRNEICPTILAPDPHTTFQALVQSILLCAAETWPLNTQQANKLLATEMDFWRGSARKSRKDKVRNVTITEVMEVGKNILEVTEEKRLRWFGHVERMPGNRLPLKILE
jgi:hypothetical protein